MENYTGRLMTTVVILTLSMIGCNENESARLAQTAEENLERQAEQNQQLAELQREVAEGSRRLVEADAEARREVLAAQQQLQSEQVAIGKQRDVLEHERREIAQQRHRDPLIANAITGVGLLLSCLLPLILCWYLLCQPVEPTDDSAVAEVLLADLVANDPLLLAPRETMQQIRSERKRPPSTLEDKSSNTEGGNHPAA